MVLEDHEVNRRLIRATARCLRATGFIRLERIQYRGGRGCIYLAEPRPQSLRKDLSWSSMTERRVAFQSTTALRFMLRGSLPRITYAAMIMVFSRP